MKLTPFKALALAVLTLLMSSIALVEGISHAAASIRHPLFWLSTFGFATQWLVAAGYIWVRLFPGKRPVATSR